MLEYLMNVGLIYVQFLTTALTIAFIVPLVFRLIQSLDDTDVEEGEDQPSALVVKRVQKECRKIAIIIVIVGLVFALTSPGITFTDRAIDVPEVL